MKNWTIGKRITLGVGILCALLILVGAIAWQSLGKLRADGDSLKTDVMPGVIDSSVINLAQTQNMVRSVLYALEASPEERAALKKEMADFTALTDQHMKSYGDSIFSEEDRANFKKYTDTRDKYRAARASFFKLLDEGKNDEAIKVLKADFLPAFKEYSADGDVLFGYNAKRGDFLGNDIDQRATLAVEVILSITACALVSGALVGFFIIRGTNKVLSTVAEQLGAGADQTAAAAGQVSTSSQSLAEGASEQAASLEETSASLEEISSMTKRNAESATRAKDLSNQTRQAAETGAASMAEMKVAMDAIKDSSANIAKIVKTIDEIAFQTNILALNAAVEAARAGEAGAGFAVVADEVRSLAQRSAQSAKETASKIEDSVSRSEHGVQIGTKVAQSFEQIVVKARQVDELVAEIATASQEQTQGIGQVSTAVSQMDKVTQSNAAGAEEAASASEELNAQAEMMRESVRELQQLVGATTQRTAAAAPKASKQAPARKAVKTPSVPTVAREAAPSLVASRSHGAMPAVAANGNGHDEFFQITIHELHCHQHLREPRRQIPDRGHRPRGLRPRRPESP